MTKAADGASGGGLRKYRLPAVTAWLDVLRTQRQLSPHTLVGYAHDIDIFCGFLQTHAGGTPPTTDDLVALPLRDLRSWLAALAEAGLDVPSRARATAAVRSFFRWLGVSTGHTNPALALLRQPKSRPPLPHPLTRADTFRLLDSGQADPWVTARDRALFTLLYGAGLRLSEALSLTVEDGTRDILTILGKGQKQRRIPLLPPVRAALADWITARGKDADPASPLFIGARGDVLNPGVAQRQMRRLRASANLPTHATPHALRHSFATALLNGGAELRAVQELLGHASLSTTQRYTDVEAATLQRVHATAHPRDRMINRTEPETLSLSGPPPREQEEPTG